MWRLEDWQNPYEKDTSLEGVNIKEVYEAGADAMLKAVLPVIEREIRAHTSVVSADAILQSKTFLEMRFNG